VGFREAGPSRQQGNREIAALNAAKQCRTKALAQLGNVHLWNIHCQTTAECRAVRFEETELRVFAFIS